ncbi:MAG TPA: phosphoribosylanthranilate isomerase [Coriobacteriia bacterium]
MTTTRGTRTRVKVCGLTRGTDARAAVLAGADALGVVLVPGARRGVTLTEAEAVFAEVPPFVARVGVFVDAPITDVLAAVGRLGLDAVQFSGQESPEACEQVPVPVVKAFHVGPGLGGVDLVPYEGVIAGALFDTAVPGEAGGTGRTFAWSALAGLVPGLPVILAGGLTPENVRAAILLTHPYAVDVSSGVESALREKDPARIDAFVAEVRAADAASAGTMRDE